MKTELNIYYCWIPKLYWKKDHSVYVRWCYNDYNDYNNYNYIYIIIYNYNDYSYVTNYGYSFIISQVISVFIVGKLKMQTKSKESF